ncbi:MAG: hypothetical protein WCT53_00555 [Candidatus Gracilibacteria bacterium]
MKQVECSDARPAHAVLEGYEGSPESDTVKILANMVLRRVSADVCLNDSQQNSLLSDLNRMAAPVCTEKGPARNAQLALSANVIAACIGTSRMYCDACLYGDCKKRDPAFPFEEVQMRHAAK